MDLRIRGGSSVDATGSPALAGDVEIEAGRIVGVAEASTESWCETIGDVPGGGTRIVQRAMGIERVLVDDGTHNDTRAGPPLARG